MNNHIVNNDDIVDAQWHLDQLINNNNVNNQHVHGIQNFINIVNNALEPLVIVNNNVMNNTINLVLQLRNIVGGHVIRRRLIVELEYEIGIRGNAINLPVAWVQNIIPRLVAARNNNNNAIMEFVNNFLNNAQGYTVQELTYVLEQLRNMNMAIGG
jgi:hypothetical protein